MGDSQGNPFISNPFMQGAKKKPPVSPEPEHPSKSPKDLSLSPPEKLSERPNLSKKEKKTTAPKTAKPTAKSLSKSTAAKSRSTNKRKRASQPVAPPTAPPNYTGNGYKVQVLAKIPMPTNTNMPSRDYLWFAVYPIIPRVGDCIFHDGRYFRVDAVFLYESTNASWCADLEVSYYTRRQ
ncbi:hypothetical protein [Leptothoe spongobia]|uniref:Uncharacterized protein n=1 Tax=Leptothoe spongobia TAU-MAC 1115 TaxID=1967444 RepID=A0A947DF20_9CYAN|nr:hypothetical protein [Leptothoe spongobia]MBT9315378.1 hypothetical protein [Leptothoe spongobia TAU-MAC 1115]